MPCRLSSWACGARSSEGWPLLLDGSHTQPGAPLPASDSTVSCVQLYSCIYTAACGTDMCRKLHMSSSSMPKRTVSAVLSTPQYIEVWPARTLATLHICEVATGRLFASWCRCGSPPLVMEPYIKGCVLTGLVRPQHWQSPPGPFPEQFGAVTGSTMVECIQSAQRHSVLLLPGVLPTCSCGALIARKLSQSSQSVNLWHTAVHCARPCTRPA